jgi:tetratricopeptide (TPR) repeat protein
MNYINKEHKIADDYLNAQKYDKAIDAFNKALKSHPNHPDLLSQRGVVYLHMQQKSKCLKDLEKALDLEQDNPYRYASLAYAEDYFGNIDKAISLYEKAVEIDPEDAIAYNNLGLLQEKKGYQSKAKSNFERADKLSKIENKIFDALDQDMGSKESEMEVRPTNGTKLQPKKLEADKKQSSWDIIKGVFTDKSTFTEFKNFVRNGFKREQ